MSLPIDVGNAKPTGIQEYDGFDVIDIDENRWNTPVENGETTIKQEAGYLVFTNNGGVAGTSYLETVSNFGKNWRISVDLALTDTTGGAGAVSLCLYKSADCYIKMGPYKSALVNSNCYLQYKNGTDPEKATSLTGDVVNETEVTSHTFIVTNDTVIIYYKGVVRTSIPMRDLHNYKVLIMGACTTGTTFEAVANDYEAIHGADTLWMTIGMMSRMNMEYLAENNGYLEDIIATLAGGIANDPIITDITGNISLSSTTEAFLELTKTVYGKKFKVCFFADLEGANIDVCTISDGGGAVVDQTANANNLISNNVRLCTAAGAQVNDIVYFRSLSQFKRLDVYMEGGTSNTDNIYVWEYWNGAAWATLTVTDGTLYNSKVFGKSGSVTWTTELTIPAGWNEYVMRARITSAGSSLPKATHVQISRDGETGFDSLAAFLSNLMVNIYRKRADGSYATLPVDTAMPFTQCVLTRNIDMSNLIAWQDIKIGFKLSANPTATITIPYTAFIETIEENDP
ncbi:MAG: hypothetical protein WC929_08675 [Bacilli bacterium]|jgi:hypothetical protein